MSSSDTQYIGLVTTTHRYPVVYRLSGTTLTSNRNYENVTFKGDKYKKNWVGNLSSYLSSSAFLWPRFSFWCLWRSRSSSNYYISSKLKFERTRKNQTSPQRDPSCWESHRFIRLKKIEFHKFRVVKVHW